MEEPKLDTNVPTPTSPDPGPAPSKIPLPIPWISTETPDVRRPRVVLVDDNHHHRAPLLRALRAEGHSVRHAREEA